MCWLSTGCLQVVYRRRRNPDQPLVCLDEAGRQLPKETRVPIPMAKGRVRRVDDEYAHALKDPCDRHFPGAKTITLIQDNPDTHKKAPLYEAFPPTEACRIIERFEWVYTPDPRLRGDGSWLDMAESGLGVLSTQCLNPVPESSA